MKNPLSIAYTPAQQSSAQQLAEQLALPCMPMEQVNNELFLLLNDEWLALHDRSLNTEIHVDFVGGALAHRKKYGGGRGQAIAKAIGLKPGVSPPSIVDATAGLGKDAFVMACLGCPVTLLERSPVVSALLADAIRRGQQDADFAAILAQGFTLISTDASSYMRTLDAAQIPDVIYLDPMYPERKKSAQVKKNMQMLQKLLGHDEDTGQLLDAALACATKRVVVKRPKGADIIAGPKPTTCIESKKTRYDIYVTSIIK